MRRRALFISPIDMRERNGMMQREHQTLEILCELYHGDVDVLSLGAAPEKVREWLACAGLNASVLEGAYPFFAYLNTCVWYGGGVILCNKLHWTKRFRFYCCTPLPKRWIERYTKIVCYYPWAHRLLRLERAGAKVVVDLGDVMADRHERVGACRWISLASGDERAVIESPSQCIAISGFDVDELRRLYGIELPVAPFAPARYSELTALADGERPARVGFMGAPSYLNENILRLLADRNFLGCISKAGIDLVVAGGICESAPRLVLQGLRDAGVRIMGRIRSITEFYGNVAAVLNPVGPSTGVKIKSVETLMAGRSLITTRWGADASLRNAFGPQICCIDWPIDARSLGELAVRVVNSSMDANVAAAVAYAEGATQALRTVLSA